MNVDLIKTEGYVEESLSLKKFIQNLNIGKEKEQILLDRINKHDQIIKVDTYLQSRLKGIY